MAARAGDLVDSCHHADFREILPLLGDGSIKLIVADPPYGGYGQMPDGRHGTPSATTRACDGLGDDEARELVIDVLRLALPKLADGGCLVLFRPGSTTDPPWLTAAIDEEGWHCHHALTWLKRRTKLGRGDEAYGIATERLLVLARPDDRLVNHDGSARGDVLDFAPTRPRYAKAGEHHLFEKPLDLCRFLVGKHSYTGELVVEPFGGTRPVSRAAREMGRRWVYCETNRENAEGAAARLGRGKARRAAG